MSLRDDLIDDYNKAIKVAKEARYRAFMAWLEVWGFWVLTCIYGSITAIYLMGGNK